MHMDNGKQEETKMLKIQFRIMMVIIVLFAVAEQFGRVGV